MGLVGTVSLEQGLMDSMSALPPSEHLRFTVTVTSHELSTKWAQLLLPPEQPKPPRPSTAKGNVQTCPLRTLDVSTAVEREPELSSLAV